MVVGAKAGAEVEVGVVREEGTGHVRGQGRDQGLNPDPGQGPSPDRELNQSPDRGRGQNPNHDRADPEERTHVLVLDLEGVQGQSVNAEGRSLR